MNQPFLLSRYGSGRMCPTCRAEYIARLMGQESWWDRLSVAVSDRTIRQNAA
jgi:hypothetical protein